MYSSVSVSSILDIPAEIGTFADAVGWTTDLTLPNEPILTHPSLPGAIPFKVRALISGTNNQNHDVIVESANPIVTNTAVLRSPRLAGSSNNPTVPLPTTIHLFGSLTPEPFIACVVEYNTNLFRHLYIGNMEKIGAYDGGEVICASRGAGSVLSSNVNYNATNAFKWLFGSRGATSAFPESQCGGVHIDHVDSPEAWRTFFGDYGSTPFDSFTSKNVSGGYNDAINDGYVSRGRSPFAGVNILVPINLYAARPITLDVTFRPIGRPAGVRNIHIQDIEPGQEITLGADTWKIFPAVSKRTETAMPGTSLGGNYREFETSGYLGHAFLMS
jgi:hypothetical protein